MISSCLFRLCCLALTFALYANAALTSAARELIGNSQRTVTTLSGAIPITTNDVLFVNGERFTGAGINAALLSRQAQWHEAINNILASPLFASAAHAETFFKHHSSPNSDIDQSVAAHLEHEGRTFYHLGGQLFLTKIGPETQTAYRVFSDGARFRSTNANSALLLWRYDDVEGVDPLLILSAAFRSPTFRGSQAYMNDLVRRLHQLDQYRLRPRPEFQHRLRFDDTQRFRALVLFNRGS